MILWNGVVRTLDPSLPTCGALSIAGSQIVGGVGTHESALPTPERVDLARALRPARVHRLARPLPDLVARATGRAPRGSRLGRSGALPRRRAPAAPAPGSAARAGATRPGPRRRPRRALDAVTGDDARRRSGRRTTTRSGSTARASHGLKATWICPAASSSAGERGRAHGHPARGVCLALPRPLRRSDRGRVRRRRPGAASRLRTRAASPPSTTRTAGWARLPSSAVSTSTRA